MSEHIYIIETRRGHKDAVSFALTGILTDKDEAMAKAVELAVESTERYGDPAEMHTCAAHVWAWEHHAVRMYEHKLGSAAARP